jgi:GTP-binding protein HflX
MINNTEKAKENIYVLQPIIDNDYELMHNEIIALIESADANYIDTSFQKIKEITPATFFGSGKLIDIKNDICNKSIDTIIFNGDLSPSQVLNISEALNDIKVIDRTTLILDIFAQRANSSEGKIQIELAQLKYIYPRLKGKGAGLSRLGGGIGTRGPGETQLETDRRHIKTRIKILENQLEKLELRRDLQTERRNKNNIKMISLVGYTNTGKSTLLNTLTESDVYVKNQLFATLDPSTRKLKLENYEALLIDTVGFISSLPHNLVEAFKSTLESAVKSDLNLLVCDGTGDYTMQLETTLQTLDSLKCTTPYLIVINKSENITDFTQFPKDSIFISAKEKKGIPALLNKINEFFNNDYKVCTLKINYQQYKEYNSLKKYLIEKHIEFTDDNILINVSIPKIYLSKFSDFYLVE